MITIRAFKDMPINIGFVGEYDVRRVEFNLSHFEKELGKGNATILRRRPGDTVSYPAPLEKEGNFWYWYIKLEDTAYHGSGTAEVIYTPIDGGLAKSEFYDFLVDESLSESDSETPPAGQAYLDRVIAEVNKVTGMTAKSVPLPAGAEPTAEYADGVLTIGIPLGGDVSEAQIAQAVADYLAENPIEETDPTVPAWAKQPEKPAYTADEVGALSAETLPEAIYTALAQAKASGAFDGADGQDGITPTIGDNGNWYLGDTDTGKPSRGKTGPAGADGKSAYKYAVDGGYTGTEAEFAEKLAAEIPTVDDTLTQSGKAADAAAVGDRLSALSDEIDTLAVSGLTSTQISALNGMFKVAAYIKADVSAEYSAFKTAFGIEDSGETEPEKTLTSISAVYSGGDVSVGTSLDALTGIVVTATYSDGSTENVTGYTLSGEIAEGTNTITVSYGGKTATFTVTSIAEVVDEKWSYTLSDLTVMKGTIGNTIAGEITANINTVQANRRRHYAIETEGVKQIIYTEVSSDLESDINNYTKKGLYPIPIPKTAIKVTYSIEPATQYPAICIYEYDANTDTYKRTADPGWQLGGGTYTLTPKDNQYLTIASKYNSTGESYPIEPTAVSIVFE